MGICYALSGIIATIKNERNFRFHLIITNLIIVFAYFYGITRVEWAILAVMIGLVLSSELLNTAIERTVDTATCEIRESAKLAKDASAGAVLILAIASIIVGSFLFGDFQKIADTLTLIFTSPKILIPCLALGIFDVLFLIFGGKNGKNF